MIRDVGELLVNLVFISEARTHRDIIQIKTDKRYAENVSNKLLKQSILKDKALKLNCCRPNLCCVQTR